MLRLPAALGFLLLLSSAVPASPAATGLVKLAYTPCGGMICIPVTLPDGKSHTLLLDTGNVESWLRSDTAQALGLKLEPMAQNGKTLPGLYRLGTQQLSLQEQKLSGQFLAVSREQTGDLPPEVEGALAYPLFKDKVLQIDYAHRVVRMFEPLAADNAAPGSELRLITFGREGPPIVVGKGFTVNGRAVSAQIDTCYTGTFLVYTQAIRSLGLERTALTSRPKYFPYTDGGVYMNEADTESIGFGSYVLSSKPAPLYFPSTSGNPVHQPDGLFEATAGNALFAHSVVTLNFHSMKISVQPG